MRFEMSLATSVLQATTYNQNPLIVGFIYKVHDPSSEVLIGFISFPLQDHLRRG